MEITPISLKINEGRGYFPIKKLEHVLSSNLAYLRDEEGD